MAEGGVVRRFNVRVPLREGITLSADLVLPGKLPAPVVVVSTPYGKAGERQSQRGSALANFAAMIAAGRAGQRLLMGPWGHAVNTTRKLGEVDFGPDALIDLDARRRRLVCRAADLSGCGLLAS